MNIRTWSVPDENKPYKKFRFAFVISPGQFDFSPLKPYCERMIFTTDGFADSLESIREQLEENFVRFDPNKDVIISTGKSVPSVMAGMIIMRLIQASDNRTWDSVAFGLYHGGDYVFWRVPINPAQEIYNITDM